MSSCPNKSFKTDVNQKKSDWDLLVEEVGEFEAYRDYMETDGEIRSSEAVKNKLDMRKGVP